MAVLVRRGLDLSPPRAGIYDRLLTMRGCIILSVEPGMDVDGEIRTAQVRCSFPSGFDDLNVGGPCAGDSASR